MFDKPKTPKNIFALMLFGPGSPEYLINLKSWYQSNKSNETKFIILQDSALPAKEGDALFNLQDQLKKEGIEAEIVDIRKKHEESPIMGMSYVDWLINNLEANGKPPYTFISDALRFIGLKWLNENYSNAERIFMIEGDTCPTENNWLNNQKNLMSPPKQLIIFGKDRAVILSNPQSSNCCKAITSVCQAYDNIAQLILSKNLSDTQLGNDIPDLIKKYNPKIPLNKYLGNELYEEYLQQTQKPAIHSDLTTYMFSVTYGIKMRIDILAKQFKEIPINEQCGLILIKEPITDKQLSELKGFMGNHISYVIDITKEKLFFVKKEEDKKPVWTEMNITTEIFKKIKETFFSSIEFQENETYKNSYPILSTEQMKKLISLINIPSPGGIYHQGDKTTWSKKTLTLKEKPILKPSDSLKP